MECHFDYVCVIEINICFFVLKSEDKTACWINSILEKRMKICASEIFEKYEVITAIDLFPVSVELKT